MVGIKTITPNNITVNHKTNCGWFESIVYDKKCQHSDNYFWCEDGGAYVVGTPLVKGIINVAEYLYRDFNEDRIEIFKREILGIWAAFIYKEGKLYCFNDYWGLYDICYNCSIDNTFIVSTSLADVYFNLPSASIDEYSFI